MNVIVIENHHVYIFHQSPENVQADRTRYKQRIHSAVEAVNLVATSNQLVIEGYTKALNEALRRIGTGIRGGVVEPGVRLQTEGYYSIKIDWSKGEWEIVGLD